MTNIYLDLDDVVADWKGYARAFFNKTLPEGERLPEEQWNKLKQDQRLYSKLALKEDANELVNWCKEYQRITQCGLFFLTAIPRNNDMPWAIQDKVIWVEKNFPGIPVFFGPYSHEKHVRCTGYNDILIDDRTTNIKQWQAAGGRGHVYKNWADCKIWLNTELGGIIK